ncbi:AAA family ATPase [Cupriavidus sp. WKF15]|uniref:AAA family ATPase n=1 Tax=Cupriavidus sp. WKF15 TaxID=3032282 RepID=UPI0023E3149C|nr:AAA family ATPase [Cupriavidus sp. WKF15]WER47511.1 AAA family ATPase [Cupriavidus sp. WKF15]
MIDIFGDTNVFALSDYRFETIHQDGIVALSRGVPLSGGNTLLLAHAASSQVEADAARCIRNEYALRTLLHDDWALVPRGITHYRSGIAAFYDDRPMVPVAALLRRRQPVARVLAIALGAAGALRSMHESGLIHRAITPASLFADAAGHCRIGHFGFAVRQSDASRDADAGHGRGKALAMTMGGEAPAYMSPEHTGRTRQAIDARSDLYSLGVILYQMLTGRLPLAARNPGDLSEWIHSHVASAPVPVHRFVPEVPETLSRIVLKLLDKSPARRYQSAAGLEADLRRCMTAWQETRQIEPFEPGERDQPAGLELPEGLFARDNAMHQLSAAFDRVIADNSSMAVALTGPSGIGKTALMQAFARCLQRQGVWCSTGKADQFRQDMPYVAIAEAFQGLVHQILALPEEEVHAWQRRLAQTLGVYGEPACRVAPALRLLVSDFPPLSVAAGDDPDVHVDIAMRQLVSAFARADRPLVLLIDDCQWLDAPSRHLLARLIRTPSPLLLVCSARSVNAEALKHLRECVRMHDVVLKNFSEATVANLLAETLRTSEQDLLPLAQLVHHKTLGNPFFVTQFLTTLVDDRLLVYSADAEGWQYDLQHIAERAYTDNVAALVLQRLERLPQPTRRLLSGMACLGRRAPVSLLGMTFGLGEHALHAQLAPARTAGVVLLAQDGTYAFAHDRVQEAAHAGLTEDERAGFCLRAGRLLAARVRDDLGDAQRDDFLFRASGLLAQAAALVTEPDEALDVAWLFHAAALRARHAAAYGIALGYVESGMKFLRQAAAPQPASQELEFALLEQQANCWFQLGHLDDALALAGKLIERPAGPPRQASVYRLKIEMHTRLSQNALAVETAIDSLRLFGITLSPHPGAHACDALYASLLPLLTADRLPAMIALPEVRDAQTEAAMSLLSALLVPASFTDEHLAFLGHCEMLRLTLAHGMSAPSTASLAWLGVMVCHRYGAYADGFRYGQMAHRLVTHHGYAAYEARTLLPLDQLSVWTQPLSFSIECSRAAMASGVAHGDMTTACYACCHIVASMLVRGDRLDDICAEIGRGLELVRRAGFRDVELILQVQQRHIDGLRAAGLPAGEAPESDGDAAEGFAAERLTTLEFWQWLYRATRLLLADQPEAAARCLEKADALAWSAPGHIHQSDFHVCRVLATASLATRQDEAAWQRLRADARRIRAWADANPASFADKALLVEAEVARLEGDALGAMSRYEAAIAQASTEGFVQIAALAHERAAGHCDTLGLASSAMAHRRAARDLYRRWGATGKVGQMEAKYPDLVDHAPTRTWSLGEGQQSMDAESVIRASRALTEEIRLDGLIDKLMTIVLEYSAAQRGLLIHIRPEGQSVEARADTGADGIRVHLVQERLGTGTLPLSMVNTAVRSGQATMASAGRPALPFARDPYFAAHPECSAICIPMLRHNEVIGALYLENRLVRDAFTLEQARLLELIAAQAAISLRSARLYDDLLTENERRKKVERELRASEASLAMGERLSQTGSWRWDLRHDRFRCSEELRRIYELDPSRQEFAFEDFVARMHPEDRETIRRVVSAHTEQWLPIRVEHRIVRTDGSIRHLAAIGEPLPADDGTLQYFGTVTDITARRQAEDAVRSAQADLARVARATTAGQLTASIAHEINQPLMSIVSNAGASLRWLARPVPDIANAREGLEAIASEGQRAGEMIRSLQALTRNAAPALAPVDLHDAVRHILVISRSEIERRQIAVKLALHAENPTAFGDGIQLQQVILNLVVNAMDAMSEIDDRPRVMHINTRNVDGTALELSVADNGIGIGANTREQLFEPFYTTKANGMGMGLAICRSIISGHRGQLHAAPLVPHGSMFAFTIPSERDAGPASHARPMR